MKTIDQEIQSKFDSEQHRALINLLYTANWFKYNQTDLLRDFDCTIQQYNILRILKGSDPDKMSMQSIVGRMIDKAPNATRLANRLLEKGYVERTNCEEDRRVIYLKITSEGKNFLKRVDKAFKPQYEEITGRLTNKEAETINLLLDKLRNTKN